jgi:DNA ligase-associated metallophosphoesterase
MAGIPGHRPAAVGPTDCPTMAELEAGGVRLQLLPGRAAFAPDERTLLVADVHFGKAASFRRLGVPVPSGTTAETLAALDALLDGTRASRLVFVGDLLHAARGRTAAVVEVVAGWRARHADVDMLLVRGNHDRRAGDPPPEWRIDAVDAPWPLAGRLVVVHEPEPVAGAYAVAGHLHPAVVIGGRARDRLRLPCFHFGAQVGVLPAFGAFTGAHVVVPAPGERIFAVADERVVEVPNTAR